MNSGFATSLLLPPADGRLVVAVLTAEATATTYLIHGCPTEIEDLESCDASTNTLIMRPWARLSSPADAITTGTFDALATWHDGEEELIDSTHCEMSGTIPKVCTVIDEGDEEDPPTQTLTLTEGQTEYDYLSFTPYPVTITAGLELLAAAQSSYTATANDDNDHDHDTTKVTTSENTLTESPTSETEAPGSTSTSKEASIGAPRPSHRLAAITTAVLLATAALL